MDEKTEKDIIKCSRCGLCADVCPLYKVKRTEGNLLRGKFLQLFGLIRGDLKFSKSLKASIDECLGCEKCISQCPSSINAPEIFNKVKSQNLSFLDKVFSSRLTFKIKILALSLFYRAKHPVKRLKTRRKPLLKKEGCTLTHFNGCLSQSINPDFWLPFEIADGGFLCCGLPYKSKGNFDEYGVCRDKNVEIIEKTKGLVVFNCATCLSAVKSYAFNTPETKDKCVFYTDIYKSVLDDFKLSAKTKTRVAFHYPCHLKSAGVKLSDVEYILRSIENVEYVSLENPVECCGFSGDYFTRHPKTADFLSTKKADDIINAGVDIVLTACPTCLWSLKYGLKKRCHFKTKAMDLAEYLSTLDFTPIEN